MSTVSFKSNKFAPLLAAFTKTKNPTLHSHVDFSDDDSAQRKRNACSCAVNVLSVCVHILIHPPFFFE